MKRLKRSARNNILSLRLGHDEWAEVQRVMDLSRVTRTEIMRSALNLWLDTHGDQDLRRRVLRSKAETSKTGGNMIDGIMKDMESGFKRGVFQEETSFYFSMEEIKLTVKLGRESYQVERGKTVEQADCICKTGPEMFRKIWCDGYQPGMKDFFGGAIKSNAPQMLQQFLKAFGK